MRRSTGKTLSPEPSGSKRLLPKNTRTVNGSVPVTFFVPAAEYFGVFAVGRTIKIAMLITIIAATEKTVFSYFMLSGALCLSYLCPCVAQCNRPIEDEIVLGAVGINAEIAQPLELISRARSGTGQRRLDHART